MYEAAATVLAANPHDIPFALIYRIDDGESDAQLTAVAGIEPGIPAAPRSVRLHEDGADPWSLRAVVQSGQVVGARGSVAPGLRCRAAPGKLSPQKAMVLPVLLPGQEHPRAILVAAVSPMRALDEDYRTFFGLIATQIASAARRRAGARRGAAPRRGARRARSRQDRRSSRTSSTSSARR